MAAWRSRPPLTGSPSLHQALRLLSVLLLLVLPSSGLHASRELRPVAATDADPPVFCADVGVEISFPSADVEAAMADLREEDGAPAAARGYAPESCLRSSLMLDVGGHMKRALRNFAVSALDCVTAPLDTESSTIALFSVTSVCSRSNVALETDEAAWTSGVMTELDELFALSSGHRQRITFATTTGLLRQVAISKTYALPPDGNGVPVLDLKAVSMWSEGEEGEDAADDGASVFTLVKLDVGNLGAIPLHLFRVTVATQQVAAVNMDDTADASSESTAFVIPLVKSVAVAPGASSSLTFKAVTPRRIEPNTRYVVYMSHSGFRAHVFGGELRGDRQFSFEKPAVNAAALRAEGGGDAGVFARYAMPSSLLESKLSAFPLATWQMGLAAIAVAVGLLVTTFFLRRKFRGIYYLLCWCCSRASRGKSVPKRSKGLRSKAAAASRYSSGSAETDETDRAIEMKRFSSDSNARAAASGDNAPFLPSRQRLQVKSPEISLARSAQASTGSRLPVHSSPLAKTAAVAKTVVNRKPTPQREHEQQAPVSPAAPTTLELDSSARLEPQRFETMWDEYAQRYQATVPQAAPPKESALMVSMERAGILCMASGTVNGVEKYVFYAKERACAWFFLVAVDVVPAGNSVTITVRTSRDASDECVEQLAALVLTSVATSSAA